jgi:Na+-translocating ferredoxin:NAD+ oxidoreductase RNF subunit RnfB
MCQPATCQQCGKTTWAGCGQHVDQVMKDVAPVDRCPGHEQAPTTPGFFSRLFSR